MTFKRIGLATAVVALTALPACSMWHSMTDRMTGRSSSGSTATTSRGAPAGTPATSGTDASAVRRSSVTQAGAEIPRFGSYNECRAWFAQPSQATQVDRTLNQGAMQGGEITRSDHDPCRTAAGRS